MRMQQRRPSLTTRLQRNRSASKMSLLVALTLMLTSYVNGYAPASQQPGSKQKPTALDELARELNACQVNLDHAKRQLLLDTEREKLSAEAIELRDQKIKLLQDQVTDARKALEELKQAGAADQATIKALKEEVSLLNKEIRTLKVTGFLTGRLSVLMIFAAAVVGFLLGRGGN